ncbi:hypothetical protein ACVIIV_002929 [Bradyrhizobium sp. USDA 4354]
MKRFGTRSTSPSGKQHHWRSLGESDRQQCGRAAHLYRTEANCLDPDDVLSSIGLGMNAEDQDNIDGDVDLMCSLGRTPTRETERLFLGGNLESYRAASEANPYKRGSNE